MKISWRRALLFEAAAIIFGLLAPILAYIEHGAYDFFLAAKLFLIFFTLLHIGIIVEELSRYWSNRKSRLNIFKK